jgi:hypothetical protein
MATNIKESVNLNRFGEANRRIVVYLLTLAKTISPPSPEVQKASREKLLAQIEELRKKQP